MRKKKECRLGERADEVLVKITAADPAPFNIHQYLTRLERGDGHIIVDANVTLAVESGGFHAFTKLWGEVTSSHKSRRRRW